METQGEIGNVEHAYECKGWLMQVQKIDLKPWNNANIVYVINAWESNKIFHVCFITLDLGLAEGENIYTMVHQTHHCLFVCFYITYIVKTTLYKARALKDIGMGSA